MPKIAFWDVDHTITCHATGYMAAKIAIRKGLVRPQHLLAIPFVALWYRAGPLQKEDSAELPSRFSALAGLSKEDLHQIGEEAFHKYIRHDIYPEALELISKQRQEGQKIILATSSFDFLLGPLAGLCRADMVLANQLDLCDGISTGRLNGGMMFGSKKRDMSLALMRELGAAPDDCAFYSDSIHDAPLLQAVRYPHAVNPDRRLKALAQKESWPILNFKL